MVHLTGPSKLNVSIQTCSMSAKELLHSAFGTFIPQGFKVIWTEVQDFGERAQEAIESRQCESTYHFLCDINKYCIVDKLRCDGVNNCGEGDKSDEHCE